MWIKNFINKLRPTKPDLNILEKTPIPRPAGWEPRQMTPSELSVTEMWLGELEWVTVEPEEQLSQVYSNLRKLKLSGFVGEVSEGILTATIRTNMNEYGRASETTIHMYPDESGDYDGASVRFAESVRDFLVETFYNKED